MNEIRNARWTQADGVGCICDVPRLHDRPVTRQMNLKTFNRVVIGVLVIQVVAFVTIICLVFGH